MSKYKYALLVPTLVVLVLIIKDKPHLWWVSTAIPILFIRARVKKDLKRKIEKEDLHFDPEKMTKTIDMNNVASQESENDKN